MRIKFKVVFSNGNVSFIEYLFRSWNDCVFDMLHYNDNGDRIDSKTVVNIQVRKAIRNLVERGTKNGAKINIVERELTEPNEVNVIIVN